MDTESTTTTKSPPYIAFKTFLNFLDRLNEGGVPGRIDRTYWGKFLNGTVGAQLMSALRSLELIDDGNAPRPILKELANPNNRKHGLDMLWRRAYGPIVERVSLENATWGLLEDAFRETYGIKGGTTRKVIAFFINGLEYIGVPVSPFIGQIRKTPGPRRGSTRRKVAVTPQAPASTASFAPPVDGRLHKAVQGFIDDIPSTGQPWSDEQIDKWLASFGVILKHVYSKDA